jgi:hypothetical protein
MMMEVIRGGAGRNATRITNPPAPPLAARPNAGRWSIDEALSDDPGVRRRELLVVAAICAARARGARERADFLELLPDDG